MHSFSCGDDCSIYDGQKIVYSEPVFVFIYFLNFIKTSSNITRRLEVETTKPGLGGKMCSFLDHKITTMPLQGHGYDKWTLELRPIYEFDYRAI